MPDRDLASDLEFWSGRAHHDARSEGPAHPRPSFRSSPFQRWWSRGPRVPAGRARPVAAAALLVALTTAWLVVGHRSNGAQAGAPTTSESSAPGTSIPAPPTTVPIRPGCRDLAPERSAVRCVIDAVDVDVRLYSTAIVADAYRRAAGAIVAPRSGPPACARGVPDERAWSVAAAPVSAVGRYRCRFEHGRAAMWWTHGDRLVHAVARNGDLGELFSWWRVHPFE
jgi:hypothetical protein